MRNKALLAVLLLVTGLVLGLVLNRSVEAVISLDNILVSENYLGTGAGNASSPLLKNTYAVSAPISANGRFVVFYSDASDLVAGDTNSKPDVFVRDLQEETTARVSVSSSGVQANAGIPMGSPSYIPLSQMQNVAISSTGRYVTFISGASNLIDGQTLASYQTNQVYIHDTKTGITKLVTKTPSGTPGYGNPGKPSPMYVKSVSDDGRFVLWGGYRNIIIDPSTPTYQGLGHVYLTDLKDDKTKLLSVPDGYSGTVDYGFDASMSCDGAVVAFTSDLVFDSGDTNSARDVFLLDMRGGDEVKRLTDAPAGSQTHDVSMSCNGQYITFSSNRSDLSTLVPSSNYHNHRYLYDRIEEDYTLVDVSAGGSLGNNVAGSQHTAAVDDYGNVAFNALATNLIDGKTMPDRVVYIRHKQTGMIEALSVNASGATVSVLNSALSVSMSANGKRVAYPVPMMATPMIPGIAPTADIIVSETGL